MPIQHADIPEAQLHEPKGVSTAVNGSVYISNGSASGAWSWQPQAITIDIANLDTVADYYLVLPHACTITKIYSVIDTAIATADKVLTTSINGVAVTAGVITITQAASAAGDVDSSTPTGANTLTAGGTLKIAATGGATGSARCHITVVYTRTV